MPSHQARGDPDRKVDLKTSLTALLKSHFPKDRLKKEREAMIPLWVDQLEGLLLYQEVYWGYWLWKDATKARKARLAELGVGADDGREISSKKGERFKQWSQVGGSPIVRLWRRQVGTDSTAGKIYIVERTGQPAREGVGAEENGGGASQRPPGQNGPFANAPPRQCHGTPIRRVRRGEQRQRRELRGGEGDSGGGFEHAEETARR
jgi:hypothetical protein